MEKKQKKSKKTFQAIVVSYTLMNFCYNDLHFQHVLNFFSKGIYTQNPGSSAYTQHWVLYTWDQLIMSISQVGKPLHESPPEDVGFCVYLIKRQKRGAYISE